MRRYGMHVKRIAVASPFGPCPQPATQIDSAMATAILFTCIHITFRIPDARNAVDQSPLTGPVPLANGAPNHVSPGERRRDNSVGALAGNRNW